MVAVEELSESIFEISTNTCSKLKTEELLDEEKQTDDEEVVDSEFTIQFESMLADGLSQLGYIANGTSQAFLNLNLMNKDLHGIDFLESYEHIQILDVSHNHLSDLGVLKYLNHLISLNASYNDLTDVIDFNPPIGLREMNFSNNKIGRIKDLSCHALLNTLLLDHNMIVDISGIAKCNNLKNLSLSYNKISKMSGLDDLPLRQLDLSNNSIKKIENIDMLKYLQYINLAENLLRSLRGLQNHSLLEEINLEGNQILDISEIRYVRDLRMLRILSLNRNPIQETTDYRLSVLFRIMALVELDGTPVCAEEKVAALNLYHPSANLIASRDRMYNVMKSYHQPVVLLDSTLANSDPYPMLIITGPSGLGKKWLAQQLCEEFPNYFGMGVSHTTRGLVKNTIFCDSKSEKQGSTYHYISKEEFEMNREQGMFIQTCSMFGNFYGVSRQSIESVAEKGLACVLTMELEGVMAFKKTHFEPRYVLLLPEDKKVYKQQLEESERYTESQITLSLEKVEKYIELNQDHPGYFDATIVIDDFQDRYVQLKNTVLDYLGLTPPNSAKEPIPTVASQAKFDQRLFSKEKTLPSSSYPIQNNSSSVLKMSESNVHPPVSPAAIASYERRYEKTKAAMMGVTSSFDEQLAKVRTPFASATIPHVRASANLVHSFTEDVPHTSPVKITTAETMIVKGRKESDRFDNFFDVSFTSDMNETVSMTTVHESDSDIST